MVAVGAIISFEVGGNNSRTFRTMPTSLPTWKPRSLPLAPSLSKAVKPPPLNVAAPTAEQEGNKDGIRRIEQNRSDGAAPTAEEEGNKARG